MSGIKSNSKISTILLIFVLAVSALPMGQASASGAPVVIGYEDFDGGAINLTGTMNVFD